MLIFKNERSFTFDFLKLFAYNYYDLFIYKIGTL